MFKRHSISPLWVVLVLFTLLMNSTESKSQCKHFSKKKCTQMVDGLLLSNRYVINNLFEGETVDFLIPFYGGQEYKLALCSQEMIKETTFFSVYSDEGDLLYDSKNGEDTWRFELESFQVFKVEIRVESKQLESDIIPSGCASLLVGIGHLIDQNATQAYEKH